MAEIASSADANGATANRSFARIVSEISRRLVSLSMTTIMGVKPVRSPGRRPPRRRRRRPPQGAF